MILDQIKNIDLYKSFSSDIYEGLKFIRDAEPEIPPGVYTLNDNVKAIVSEYYTKEIFERGWEAHKHVIDIQYPIIGLERIKWSPVDGMDVNIEYDPVKDRTFFKNPSDQGCHMDIGNGIFAIMFPEDGHSPQHFINEPELIKKITVKVRI